VVKGFCSASSDFAACVIFLIVTAVLLSLQLSVVMCIWYMVVQTCKHPLFWLARVIQQNLDQILFQ